MYIGTNTKLDTLLQNLVKYDKSIFFVYKVYKLIVCGFSQDDYRIYTALIKNLDF